MVSDFKKDILVSISCITYNHVQYIRQCLDSFLMQKTNFAFEILVHDDCSTDGTTEIIKEYEKKYPNIIKPMYEKENQYQQGKPIGSAIWNYPRARGKYIALCEGDDYWIDSFKLQRQVEFMELHPDYSLCFHNYFQLLPDKKLVAVTKNLENASICSIYDAILTGGGYMGTNTMLFRATTISNYPVWATRGVGDFPLMLILFHLGKVAYLDFMGSVYRINSIGSWSERMNDLKFLKEHFQKTDAMLFDFDNWSNKKYHKIIFFKRCKNKLVKIKLIFKIRYGYSLKTF